MSTQNWPKDPLVPSTTGNESSTSDLGTTQLGTSSPKGGQSSDSKADAAKDQAKQVGQDGKQAAQNVAGTAASEAKSVAAEASSQAKDLFGTVSSEVQNQAGAQQQKVTEGLRGISDELKSMADKSDNQMVAGLVQQASQRAHTAAGWLDGREATEVLEDVKSFARRKPGTFLAIAAGTGFVVGRLTRGAVANRSSNNDTNTTQGRSVTSSTQGTTGTYAGYTEVDRSAYSGTQATAGLVDPADDYPTIPPGTPPVSTRPLDGGLR